MRPATEVLFPEARQRERRRRLLVVAAVLILLGAAMGIILDGSGPGGGHRQRTSVGAMEPSAAVAKKATVAVLDLTKSDRYGAIATVGGHVFVFGPAANVRNPAASSTCNSAIVNPSSLHLSDVRSGSCADPSLDGRQVLPVFSTEQNVPFVASDGRSPGGPSAAVRIAHVTATRPGYALGPVVMTFPALAYGDTSPMWVYGGGDLWIYGPTNPSGFDLLRVSGSTGAVLQQLKVPEMNNPVLAFDDDGLYIGSPSASLRTAIYRLTPGAQRAVPVFNLHGANYVRWIVAAGHEVWFEVADGARAALWTLRGVGASPTILSPPFGPLMDAFQAKWGSSGMVGDAADGLWFAAASPSGEDQQVLEVDPRTGSVGIEATLKPAYSPADLLPPLSIVGTSWQAVALDGSLYLLDPPAMLPLTANKVGGFSAIYRITPKATRAA